MSGRTREKNSESADDEKMEWSAEEEIQLFFALDGLKPVGINKHFFMACICDRLSKALNRDIATETIWSHLKSMYNLKVLDDLEKLPFPNNIEDFSLPESEFNALIAKKKLEIESEQKKLNETVKKEVENGNKINNKTPSQPSNQKINQPVNTVKDVLLDKKVAAKIISSDTPKRPPKRTRGSMSLESNSPSTTPPPTQSNKRRRI